MTRVLVLCVLVASGCTSAGQCLPRLAPAYGNFVAELVLACGNYEKLADCPGYEAVRERYDGTYREVEQCEWEAARKAAEGVK